MNDNQMDQQQKKILKTAILQLRKNRGYSID